MNKIEAWVDAIPWPPLLVIVLILGGAPFVPEPHLVGKIRMLANGTLVRPIDIFDLLYHSAPLVVLLWKLIRLKTAPQTGQE